MEVSSETVARLAVLARISVSADEAARLAGELNGILEHVEALREVDVAHVDAIGDVTADAAEPRADLPAADELLAPLTAFAPQAEAGFFTVPRLGALDSDSGEHA
jgi:aspartyl-tRNA(Asn)/glutamyl-tRNA(Gln) amidotransferase subunit C